VTDPTLRRDSRGDDVVRLQRALAAAGLQVVADGIFGPGTEATVKRFQSARQLVADGIVGPLTWKALRTSPASPVRTTTSTTGVPGAVAALSDAGAHFIAQFEGFSSKLYDDPAGHCTIGYGHLVHHGRTNGTESAEFRAGITKERALELLTNDAAEAAAAIAQRVTVPLGQHQLDALVSFVFNVGAGAFADSTLLRELNAGRYDAVPGQLARWVKAGDKALPGLVRRRKAEGVLFAEGTY
jgi:GH24 family phage-related lysozyme (muramidase)